MHKIMQIFQMTSNQYSATSPMLPTRVYTKYILQPNVANAADAVR